MRAETRRNKGIKGGAGKLAVVAALAIGIIGGGSAMGELSPSAGGTAAAAAPVIPTGCWRLVVTPDAAAILQGRSEFEEYVTFESTGITAQEMSRLGFSPSGGTASTNAAGQTTFTVVLTSNSHGTATWSGTFGTNTVSGTLKWVKDGKTYNYTYTGGPHTPEDVES